MSTGTTQVNEASARYLTIAETHDVPPGYKRTEVGVIPEEWEVRRLDALGTGPIPPVKAGPFGSSLTKDTYVPMGYKVYGQEQVIRGDFRYGDYFVTQKKYRELESCAVRPGDILLSLVGTVGKLLEIPDAAPPGIINPRLIRFSFDKNRVCPTFFRFLFESDQAQGLLARKTQGGTMGVLNAGVLRPFIVPLPPPAEQRAIAETLSDVDGLLAALEKLIVKKRAIKQATMQQLLTGKARLPGFSGKWETKRLGDTATLKARIGWQGLTTGEYLDSGDYYLVTGTEFSRGHIDWSSCYFVDESRYKQDRHIQLKLQDVLVTKDGTIGKVALISELPAPATLNSGMFVIRPIGGSFHPEFFYYLLCSSVFEEFLNQLSAGSTINHLYQKDFVGFKYKTPPSLDEQAEIVAILTGMDKEITALECRRDKTKQIKQGMMQQLLTGRIRLVKPSVAISEKATEKASSRKANVHFIRSVLAAEIIDQLHEQPTFGHVKFEKMMFLVEHLCEVDTGSTYHRQAAGPYDNRALRSIDSQLRTQQWFDARKEGKRYQYVPMQKRGGHKRYFDRYFSGIGETFDRIIGTFKTLDTERCEIVATLLAAWSDLLRDNGAVSDELIVHEVLNNWHEAKRRIPEDRWLKALGWMRIQGFVPKGGT